VTPGTHNRGDQYTFTVFTATYNRADALHRVFDALSVQTFRDFEWLIVDDGSTDLTAEVVCAWQTVANFPIRYLSQPNRGKHIAFNRAVREAKGEFFLTLDSDDACVPNALERLFWHWTSIPESQRSVFSGVTSLCQDQRGRIVGKKFPFDPTDSHILEMQYKYKVTSEAWGFHRTAVLKCIPFPDGDYGSFLPEGIIWSVIARRLKTRYVNEPLRVYWSFEPGRTDQLTNSLNALRHARAFALQSRLTLTRDIDWFPYAVPEFLGVAARYGRFSLHAGVSMATQARQLNNGLARLLWLATLPLAVVVYWLDQQGHVRRLKALLNWF
jgi:glycosyltransferase involved in cell wall biosynthesis